MCWAIQNLIWSKTIKKMRQFVLKDEVIFQCLLVMELLKNRAGSFKCKADYIKIKSKSNKPEN